MAVPNTFTNGTVADADEVNENFTYLDSSIAVPVKCILPWAKTFGVLDAGVNTSVSASKLIDSGAAFNTLGLSVGSLVVAELYFNTDYGETANESYTVVLTETSSDNTNGFLITQITNQLKHSNVYNNTVHCKMRFYYTDSTDEYSSLQSASSSTWVSKTYANPSPNKYVWKVEVYLMVHPTVNPGYAMCQTNLMHSIPKTTSVISVDSATQITLADDYFTTTDMKFTIYAGSVLPNNFVECNGQTLSDAESQLNGQVIPNLNGNKNFVSGDLVSGTTGTLGADGTADIPYYSVVYIMRVK